MGKITTTLHASYDLAPPEPRRVVCAFCPATVTAVFVLRHESKSFQVWTACDKCADEFAAGPARNPDGWAGWETTRYPVGGVPVGLFPYSSPKAK